MYTDFLDKNNLIYKLPKKQVKKLAVLDFFIEKFDKDKIYSEKEVNEILNAYHSFNDPCFIRRTLVDYRYLERTENGESYKRIK